MTWVGSVRTAGDAQASHMCEQRMRPHDAFLIARLLPRTSGLLGCIPFKYVRRRTKRRQNQGVLDMRIDHTFARCALGVLTVGAVVALGACTSNDRARAGGDSTTVAAAGTGDTMGGMRHDSATATTKSDSAGGSVTNNGAAWNDAQIFGLLGAANTAEIAAGKAAGQKARSPRVKTFARQMVTDHTAMERQGNALAKRLNVTPAAPPDSGLIKDSNAKLQELQSKARGRDWDNSYMDSQVDAHQKTLDLIDKAAGSAQHPELKQLLQQARPKVEAHLNEAKSIKGQTTS